VAEVVLFFALLNAASDHVMDKNKMMIEASFLVLVGILIFFTFKLKTIEFDDTTMYLLQGKTEEAISLKSIYKIKMTMTRINNISMWKIEYHDTDGKEKSTRFFPKMFYKNFIEFQNTVKSANKNVDIVNWTSSFDFDQ
jgi:hypothetical protein